MATRRTQALQVQIQRQILLRAKMLDVCEVLGVQKDITRKPREEMP